MNNETKKQSPEPAPTKAELDNHAQQIDPSTDKYWKSRGFPARPEDWQDRIAQHEAPPPKK
jgi:hypothetical protein